MNDGTEYRSYGSYLGRVFSLIIGIVLILLAVWFIVQLADGDDDDTAQVNDGDTSVVVDENAGVSQGATAESEGFDVITEGESVGQALSTNTDQLPGDTTDTVAVAGATSDELPNTGPSSLISLVAIPGVVFASSYYAQARRR